MFQKARACAPSILFLDEIDSIVGKRSESGQRGVQERVLAALLNEMDGIGVRLSDGTVSSQKQRALEGQTSNSLVCTLIVEKYQFIKIIILSTSLSLDLHHAEKCAIKHIKINSLFVSLFCNGGIGNHTLYYSFVII